MIEFIVSVLAIVGFVSLFKGGKSNVPSYDQRNYVDRKVDEDLKKRDYK